ncbi:hypothetical protein MYCTH_56363 [Thermothelomyces thermophilus ATCC 42464]|uniref:Uncharacterized protein n=1 Tax=Thermothelomyces thermophilus (strain ATCC 42464 / BCRC 31852 / DSM 1799) TaxID=573729 RepID=G2QN51_THET4|nr:uncharacterized protein MYCTH_56363 [Thermothelomyces thermophilus ATCC 42464]AEO61924.1 hypothetical protein MYCTH_56363 [Thermothelomyces thermophilus ATCC 42464]
MHGSNCPKCGAASDGASKSCDSCGAVSPPDSFFPFFFCYHSTPDAFSTVADQAPSRTLH